MGYLLFSFIVGPIILAFLGKFILAPQVFGAITAGLLKIVGVKVGLLNVVHELSAFIGITSAEFIAGCLMVIAITLRKVPLIFAENVFSSSEEEKKVGVFKNTGSEKSSTFMNVGKHLRGNLAGSFGNNSMDGAVSGILADNTTNAALDKTKGGITGAPLWEMSAVELKNLSSTAIGQDNDEAELVATEEKVGNSGGPNFESISLSACLKK